MNSSETTERTGQTDQRRDFDEDTLDTGRLVPIGESIRYRRRAQSAEKQAQDLAEQLTQANDTIARMSDDLEGLQRDQELTRKLSGAGAADLEAALLMAKARLKNQAEIDLDTCIEQLKSEKQYLFRSSSEMSMPRRTAGVRDRLPQGRTALQQAATKAAQSGRRGDLQHYLQLRRTMM
jgi:TolA-binding protein